MTRQLEGVKPGDVIKCRHNYGGGYDLHKVIELTATLAKCERDTIFFLRDGLKKGTAGGGRGFNRRYGSIATPEDVAEIALANRIRAVQSAIDNRRLKVTAANLAAVEALLAPQPEQP